MKKKELDSLLQRYSSKHPDVIRLKKEIQALEVENVELRFSVPRATVSGVRLGSSSHALIIPQLDRSSFLKLVAVMISRSENTKIC